MRCYVQWGETVLAFHIGVSVFVQEEAGDLNVAVFGRDVQGGETLLLTRKRKKTFFEIQNMHYV